MMTNRVSYRRGTPADILTICELGQQLNGLHHQMRPDIYADATLDFKRDTAHWLPSLEADNHATYIAEQDGVAVGFITMQKSQSTSPLIQPQCVCRIGSICVIEEQRGRGIGLSLMRCAESWATEQGASDIRLSVWMFNEAAIGLYKELGYEVRVFEMGKRISK